MAITTVNKRSSNKSVMAVGEIHSCCRETPDTDGGPLTRKRRNKHPRGNIGFPVYLLLCSGFMGSANSSQKECFISSSRIHHDRSSWSHILRPTSLASTKTECYDTLLDDLGQERRPKSKLSYVRQKVHKRKRNKLLRDHLSGKNIINSTSYDQYETKKKKTKRKQLRRTSKSMSTSTVAQIVSGEDLESLPSRRPMPPWLARYENEDFTPYNHDETSEISEAPPKSYSDEILAAKKLKHLEQAMSGSFTDGKSTFKTKPLFSSNEILDVLDSIRVASQSNVKLVMGCADFLYLMLTLEEYDDIEMNDIDVPKTLIMTREVLVAAAFHYCDCVRARKAGVYDVVRAFMEAGVSESDIKQSSEKQRKKENHIENSVLPRLQSSDQRLDKTSIAISRQIIHSTSGKSPIQKYGNETVRIASGAAKLKRAEVMSTTVNAKYIDQDSFRTIVRKQSQSMNSEALSSNASILRSFLVSISDDWRSLVIRSAACLYRLRGIVDEGSDSVIPRSNNRRLVYSATSMQTARDALRVYAPLAQRMGMQRLKSQIENTAFRILYPRQYDVSSALHDKDLTEMQTIIQVLSSRIEQLLISDDVFVANIDNISVSSRVKEPYSLWKKILRYRKEAVMANRDSDGFTKSKFMPATLSTKWVPDAIALRVIIRGKQMPMEDEESLRTREKMLCYFALQKIGDVWPASEANFAKDYISSPKPNGYQSLHYTAALLINGEEWPFEVQVCLCIIGCSFYEC